MGRKPSVCGVRLMELSPALIVKRKHNYLQLGRKGQYLWSKIYE